MDGGGYSGDGDMGSVRTSQSTGSTKKLQQTQAQVDEVVGIMKVNVEKVLERDQKLSELDNRADALQQGAAQFEQQAGKLKRKYWWKNLKMMIIIGIIAAIILIIIIGTFYILSCSYLITKNLLILINLLYFSVSHSK